MSKITPEQIHNAMFSSQEGYVAYVIDSIEFDLDRNLTDEEKHSVEKFVDGVITTNANLKEAGEVARAALDYIDAIPAEIVATFPVMPGFDRDWAENALAGGVPDDILGQAIPTDDRFTVDMSGVEHQLDKKEMAAAIKMLQPQPAAEPDDFESWFKDVMLPGMKSIKLKEAECKLVHGVAQSAWGAVLELREVVLPERYEVDMCPTPSPDGEWYSRDDVLAALVAAGISIKAE